MSNASLRAGRFHCHTFYELTLDAPRALAQAGERCASARADLARWLAGDRAPNNALRDDEQSA